MCLVHSATQDVPFVLDPPIARAFTVRSAPPRHGSQGPARPPDGHQKRPRHVGRPSTGGLKMDIDLVILGDAPYEQGLYRLT